MLGFFAVFYENEILPKFKGFVNSDDCIGKITPKSIRLQPVFIYFFKLKLIKTDVFLMKNSGNCIYDYPHSFFKEDF